MHSNIASLMQEAKNNSSPIPSSAVINSRFKNWPYVKKLFQISHIKKINNNKINTVFIKKESPINKIIKLPELVFKIFQFLKISVYRYIVLG